MAIYQTWREVNSCCKFTYRPIHTHTVRVVVDSLLWKNITLHVQMLTLYQYIYIKMSKLHSLKSKNALHNIIRDIL